MIKIFEKGDKVNFVDSNNIMLGYDLSQQCCESAYYMTYEPMGYNDENDVFNPIIYRRIKDLPEFIERDLIREIEQDTYDDEDEDIRYAFLCTIKGRVIMIVNCHNGYYYHGFKLRNENTNKELDGGVL